MLTRYFEFWTRIKLNRQIKLEGQGQIFWWFSQNGLLLQIIRSTIILNLFSFLVPNAPTITAITGDVTGNKTGSLRIEFTPPGCLIDDADCLQKFLIQYKHENQTLFTNKSFSKTEIFKVCMLDSISAPSFTWICSVGYFHVYAAAAAKHRSWAFNLGANIDLVV